MSAAEPRKVLVVDDSLDVHRLVAVALRREGADVLSVTCAQSGIEAARQHLPDLVLLDVDMPGMDGFEACRLLKDHASTHDIPVVFLTANDDVAIKVRGFNLGAVDYIVKPWHPEELRARVRSALRTRELQLLLAKQAHTDGLTGLRNRTYFDDRLTQELERASRHDRELSLLLIDVDHFKRVNDRYGHPAGDHVLRELGRVLAAHVRTSDAACRYGGEEFAVILPETDLAGAASAAERIRLQAGTIVVPGGPAISVSIGVAHARGAAANEVVRMADAALYDAKRQGRNQVRMAA